MKKIAKFIVSIFITIATVLTLVSGQAMAFTAQEGAEAARADDMPAELIGENGVFTKFTNIALYIVGAVSVLMLIWGGLRYILSGGDSKKITDAKNTILYAIIGLVIAVLSFAIVHFVLNTIDSVSKPECDSSSEQCEKPQE